MKIKEDIHSVTYLKSRAADLLEQINETRRAVIITQKGEPRAVVLDPKSYEGMRAAVGLMKLLAQAERDITENRLSSQEEVFRRIGSRLKKKK